MIKKSHVRNGILFFALMLSACGCVRYKVSTVAASELTQKGQTQTNGNVSVSVNVLPNEEAEKIFGVNLAKRMMQAVWLEIDNRDQLPYIFFQRSVADNYFSPEEAAYRARFGAGKGKPGSGLLGLISVIPKLILKPIAYYRALPANREMEERFETLGIHNSLIPPGGKVSGFVFLPKEDGIVQIPVILFAKSSNGQETKRKEFLFEIKVPGLKADYEHSDFLVRYPEKDLKEVDLEGLRRFAEKLPCCTTDKKGKRNGDPLNLMIAADLPQLLTSFRTASWDETEAISFGTVWKMTKAFLNGEPYRYSPVSPLYYEGLKQDIAFQKIRSNIYSRLHLRLWYTPYRFEGKPVWVGQVSRDIGIRLTRHTWNLMTHKIDPNIDESREYVMADLNLAKRLTKAGYAAGVGKSSIRDPHYNLTRDPYYSDGLRLTLIFSDKPVARPFILDWELPEFDPSARERKSVSAWYLENVMGDSE